MKVTISPHTRQEFNLLDEPWVKVLGTDGRTRTLPLPDALCRAHECICPAGDMKAQDTGILRLMIGAVLSIIYKYDEKGRESVIEGGKGKPEDALRRWKAIWDSGKMPEETVRAYFERYRDRFWLFDPERPFFQSPRTGEKCTEMPRMNILYGDMKTSNNAVTRHHYALREGVTLYTMPYADAARWIVHMQFAGFAAKKQVTAKSSNPNSNNGLTSKAGIITLRGRNLFETIMLNCPALRDGTDLYASAAPAWERDLPDFTVREEGAKFKLIEGPDDFAYRCVFPAKQLLLQSWPYTYTDLQTKIDAPKGVCTGFGMAPGLVIRDAAEYEAEQMILWKQDEDSGGFLPYTPRAADHALWTEVSHLSKNRGSGKRPGVVEWVSMLCEKGLIPDDAPVDMSVYTMKLAQGASYDEEQQMTVMLPAGILGRKGGEWLDAVAEEIGHCREIETGPLYAASFNLFRLWRGDAKPSVVKEAVRNEIRPELEAAWKRRMDTVFCRWFENIDIEKDSREEKIAELRRLICDAAESSVESVIRSHSGRPSVQTWKEGDADRMISSAQILAWCRNGCGRTTGLKKPADRKEETREVG